MRLLVSEVIAKGIRGRKILDWKKISKIPYKPVEGLPRVKPQVPPHRVLQRLPESLKTLCEQMASSCLTEDGIGLAAPQIGVNLAIICIVDTQQKEIEFFFNPDWLPVPSNKTKKAAKEGCLSVANQILEVNRFDEIEARWYEYREGDTPENSGFFLRQEILRGQEARVFQHEVDHLYGRSIVDRHKNEK